MEIDIDTLVKFQRYRIYPCNSRLWLLDILLSLSNLREGYLVKSTFVDLLLRVNLWKIFLYFKSYLGVSKQSLLLSQCHLFIKVFWDNLAMIGQLIYDFHNYFFFVFNFVVGSGESLLDYQVIWKASRTSTKDICTVCSIIIELLFTLKRTMQSLWIVI